MYRNRAAFTLVELMVSTSILVLMMVILLQMTGATANTWRYGAAKAEQFQEARKAFETMTRRVSEATLNTYWDYARDKDATIQQSLATGSQNFFATSYTRQSDLRFRVVPMSSPDYVTAGVYHPTHGIFFQAPIGMVEATGTPLENLDELLNCWGYFLEVANTTKVPSFLASSYPTRTRCRLMEFRQSSERFDLYRKLHAQMQPDIIAGRIPDRDPAISTATGKVDIHDDDWFMVPIKLVATNPDRPVRVLAENVLSLVILPRLSPTDEAQRKLVAGLPGSGVQKGRIALTPDYSYHSKQLSNYAGAPGFDYPTEKKKIDAEINPKNQMPPVVQIAMVAIDEGSAQRLAVMNSAGGDLGLPDLFKDSKGKDLFSDTSRLESDPSDPAKPGDLQALEKKLIDLHLSYRLFSSNVAIRGAKWSRAQAQ